LGGAHGASCARLGAAWAGRYVIVYGPLRPMPEER